MVLHQNDYTQLTDLDPVLTDIFIDHYAQVPDIIGLIFGVRTSSKGKETDLRLGGFSDPVDFEQHGQVVYDTPDRGYEVEYDHTEWVRGFQITRAMLDDMQYDGIYDSAGAMGTAFARKRQKDAMSVFNNGFTAGTTAGYDSVALFSDSHPRSRTDSTTVDNNLASTPLNADNLETAITTLEAIGDDLGEEINIKPDILLVPRGLRRTALELTESELTPENANNAINVHTGMATVMSPYLTNASNWFVIDSMMAKKYLKWYNRVLPEFTAEDNFDTLQRKYRGYMRYSYGWSDFRFAIGCQG